jgi:HlyD family type I secretion membrane fusion protein
MKLDFLSFGGGGGDGGKRRDELLRKFNIFAEPPGPRPLDDARRVIRVGLITAAGFFGILMLFALLVPISGAAVASGEVVTSGSRIVVQPLAGGLVAEILVREGQTVREGQPLVRMNGVRSAAAAQQAQAQRDALRALRARLIAQRDGLDAVPFPPDLTNRMGEAHVASAVASQSAIFRRHQEVLSAERSIAQTDKTTSTAQTDGARKQLALIRDELAGIRKLYAKGYARITQVRALERAAADLEAQSLTGAASVSRADLQIAKLANTQTIDIVAQLGKVEEQLAQVDPALRVSRFDEARDTLRAPVAGRVSGLAKIGPGTVLGGGTTAMEIVPQGRALIVEATIRPEDIDDVRVGSPATLRFTTVNPRGQSSFDGKVVALSPASITGENGQRYFRAQIMVDDPDALTRNNVSLQPGLPVTVNVKTHSRTLFDYLFAPVADTMSGAFREE